MRMIRSTVAVVVLFASFTMCVDGQAPAAEPEPQYLFIDSDSGLDKKIIQAGNDGYGVQFVARFAESPGMILKRDGRGPRSYRLVNTARLTSFLKELNETGASGFRIVPASVKRKLAVLEQQPGGARFTYSVVQGNGEGTVMALADARKRGLALVGMFGVDNGLSVNQQAVFLYEETERAAPAMPSGEWQYRIAVTGRTSTLEKEILQTAAEGFRVTAAGGFLMVLMERNAALAPPPEDYRVIAMRRVATAERELQDAGAEGFRIAVVPDHSQEGVFVLHRTPGTLERFTYQIVRLKPKTANEQLLQADANGFRIAVLFNDLVVLERPLPR